jgi:hypothetical protein
MFTKPEMTFPSEVASVVREAYSRSQCIVEYGTGGSTALAAGMGGRTLVGMESDALWLARLNTYLQTIQTTSRVITLHEDLGPTKQWGFPASDEKWRAFPNYAFKPWQCVRELSLEPDLVLIDGRFRAGCFLASALSVQRKTELLFDDYVDRPQYHWIEKYAKPKSLVGRMAIFEIDPISLQGSDVLEAAIALHDPS